MSIYSKVNAIKPSRSIFNLSHDKKFDCDMGQIIPVMCKMMMPGDTFVGGNEVVVRTTPLNAPIFAEIKNESFAFFVPYRILMDNENDFSEFITGLTKNGDPSTVELPRWIPVNNQPYSLWDYFCFPTNVMPIGAYPLDFPRRAYNMIWNEYMRDENLQDEISLENENILYINWKKDRFTAALPWQQKGISPALPISGEIPVSFFGGGPLFNIHYDSGSNVEDHLGIYLTGLASDPGDMLTRRAIQNIYLQAHSTHGSLDLGGTLTQTPNGVPKDISFDGTNVTASVNLDDGFTFNINDLRLAFQIQRWLEKNARGGTRYTEFLMQHFGTSPRDSRLQRPQYLGGVKSTIMVSEIAQTSASEDGGTAQGNLAGKGITASKNTFYKFTAPEFGLIMVLFTIRPKASYQQGIDREWLYEDKFDFPFPTFAHLSEQPVYNAEIFAVDENSGADFDIEDVAAHNKATFGFDPIYNELRHSQNKVCAGMRDKFSYWHLGRILDEPPVLNGDFIECRPSKRIFAVMDEPGFIVNYANIVKAIRPLPKYGDPGLIDHN